MQATHNIQAGQGNARKGDLSGPRRVSMNLSGPR